jgi:hypothetical protein
MLKRPRKGILHNRIVNAIGELTKALNGDIPFDRGMAFIAF